MTMGALHAGHLALVRRAQELADHVVVTVFVNPLQFGPTEDLARYPRDLARDLALLEPLLADGDVLFAPSVAEMYPFGDPTVTVSAGRIGEVLEGGQRPGHLDGVLTVVLKLLHRTRPQIAVFGQKDAQQVAAVRAMVRDLDLAVRVEAVPTVRDDDGLALSSRNAYLSPEQRTRALALVGALRAGERAAQHGAGADGVRAAAYEVLAPAVERLDYVEVVDDAFVPLRPDVDGPATLVLAAVVGTTRLIDNVPLTVTRRPVE
ncbi:MAG: pantoate--beta-alanine ligase, partial [Actinobacteria bacterium]|nr:pantoate--beta-alanine ligase [Actinomycetota bacterium]